MTTLTLTGTLPATAAMDATTEQVELMPGSRITAHLSDGRSLVAVVGLDSPDTLRAERFEPVNQVADTRMAGPGVGKSYTLRALFESFYERTQTDRAESSWHSYRTLVNRWEEYHGGPGPDVREIDAGMITEFFMSVEKWASQRSWEKYSGALFATLKSGCPQSRQNMDGMTSEAPLTIDGLPLWKMPPERWFVNRDVESSSTGHIPSDLPPLTDDEVAAILMAANGCTTFHPLLMQAQFLFKLIYPSRTRDSLRYRYGDSHRFRVDLDRQTIGFRESKKLGKGVAPLNRTLAEVLRHLRDVPFEEVRVRFPQARGEHKARFPDMVFPMLKGEIGNLARWFYPEWDGMFERAGIEVRKPHHIRSDSLSRWYDHAPQFRFAVAGHSPGKDIQLKHYIKLTDSFVEAVQTFPLPSLESWLCC